MKKNNLTPEQRDVLVDKNNEWPFTGKYDNHYEKGIYVCGWCNNPLYKSEDKFDAYCGWPAFDDEIPGAVARRLDADGKREEIVCAHCGGHLGHVFDDGPEETTGQRYCTNSVSIKFVPETE